MNAAAQAKELIKIEDLFQKLAAEKERLEDMVLKNKQMQGQAVWPAGLRIIDDEVLSQLKNFSYALHQASMRI
jgi:hypothetical protein